jgi:hypothetical protein
MKTYKLAIETEHAIRTFGPLMTLEQAESYRDTLRNLGKSCLVVNVAAQ